MSCCFCANKHIFAHQKHSYVYCSDIVFFIYSFIFLSTVFSLFLLFVSFLYRVTLCCRTVQFLHRDHLISNFSLIFQAPLWASAYFVTRIYCTVAQWFWFSAPQNNAMQTAFETLVKSVHGVWNKLWHQSINIIFLIQANHLINYLKNLSETKGCYSEPICCVFVLIIDEGKVKWTLCKHCHFSDSK